MPSSIWFPIICAVLLVNTCTPRISLVLIQSQLREREKKNAFSDGREDESKSVLHSTIFFGKTYASSTDHLD